MKTMDLLAFATLEIPAIERDLQELFGGHGHNSRIVEKACDIVARRARRSIGQEHELWPDLAPSTIDDKQRRGFKTPAPLLRTGELRNSIEYTVKGNEGAVGSDLDIALWQEMGTSRMPARSFLRSSLLASVAQIERMAGRAIESTLSGGGHNAEAARELWHLMKEAGHAIKEAAEPFLPHEDEEGSER
jgi:hypothetical protein